MPSRCTEGAINQAPPGAVIVVESVVYHKRIHPDGVCIVGSPEGQVAIAEGAGCEAAWARLVGEPCLPWHDLAFRVNSPGTAVLAFGAHSTMFVSEQLCGG